jgi:hypothetical protein
MWQRLLFGLFLAGLAYFVITKFSKNESFNPNPYIPTPNASTPGLAPPIREPEPRGDLNLSAGGPNPPNAAADPRTPPTMSSQPEARDPYDVTTESADAPENLRHPERSFGPGVIPEATALNVAAGLAGNVASSSQAFQQFSPEFVQNGGAFFGTVSALEDENPNYSAF